MAIIWMKQAPPILGMLLNRKRKTSIQQINHYRIIRIFLCMKWYVLLLSIHFKCTYIPIRYIFWVEPQIFDLRIYFGWSDQGPLITDGQKSCKWTFKIVKISDQNIWKILWMDSFIDKTNYKSFFASDCCYTLKPSR